MKLNLKKLKARDRVLLKDYQVEIEARERRAWAIQTRLNATQQLTESQVIRIAAILDEPLVLL